MNFCLHPRVLRRAPGCEGEIVLAIWARTDPATATAPNLSIRQIDNDVGWGRPADVQRYVTRMVKRGFVEKSVGDSGVNEFRWTKRALVVNAPLHSPRRIDIVELIALDALDDQRALALDTQRALALDEPRALALDVQRAQALDISLAQRESHPYSASSLTEKKLSATAAAPGARRHRLIDQLESAAAEAGLSGDSGEERNRVLAMMRESGIDGRQAEHIADIVPAAYITANIAHCRKAINGPKGGAHFKCLCEDWANWIGKHAQRWREQQRAATAAIEAKPDQFAELAVITDEEWPAIVAEAIDAIDDAAAREQMRGIVQQHGTPRNSPSLNTLVLAHVQHAPTA